ncbi:MAG: PrsW family glutamic-type intramembrane protease [Planctomycetota bacterium]|nr:PrsW family glutamic-type intramembrane protease [Planctomycetota bacterium]
MFLTALAAVFPSLLLLWYFHSRDVYPEPPRVLWTTFGLGLLTIIPTLLFSMPILMALESRADQNPYVLGFAKAFVTAAMPEEFFKLAVLWLYCVKHEAFDEPMDGIVYGVSVSLGFATLENILFVASGGLSLAITRALTAVPGHACLGAIMGYYVGQARFRPSNERRLYLLAYLVPVMLHGLYNFPLLSLAHVEETASATTVSLLIALAVFALGTETALALKLVGSLRKKQLRQKAETQRLSRRKLLEETPVQDDVAHHTAYGWIFTVIGGVATTFGGMLTLGLTLALLFDPPAKQDMASFFLVASIIGFLPLMVGIVLFWFGIQELNKGSESEENQ